jgi:hypothetical protein
MQEYKINQFLSLRLNYDRTCIYVKNEFFRQCKSLLLSIPVSRISQLDDIESLDEAIESLGKILEDDLKNARNISPETEFWGHCSNLQVWAENEYNTNLLNYNLAFPLLKKLSEEGDKIAQKVFKEEIAKKIQSQYLPVIEYLVMEGYFKYLDQYEIEALGNSIQSVEISGKTFYAFSGVLDLSYMSQRGFKNYFILRAMHEIKGLEELRDLKVLKLQGNEISEIANLEPLIDIKRLDLEDNKITLIKGLKLLTNLKELNLSHNNITEIKNLEQLTHLNHLDLSHNNITEIKNLEQLTHLNHLDLSHNNITEIKNLEKLSNLKLLDLEGNIISKIQNLNTLINLEDLNLIDNRYVKIEGLENLKNLKYLKIDLLGSSLEGLQNLDCIKEIIVFYNESFEPLLENLGGVDDSEYKEVGYIGYAANPQNLVKYCKKISHN